MNVQPGDMARVVAPYAVNGIGSRVTVVRAAARVEDLGAYRFVCDGAWGQGWVVQGWVRDAFGCQMGPLLVIADRCLRRIDPPEATKDIPRADELRIDA